MIKLDKELLESMAALENSQPFIKVMDWLKESLKEQDIKNHRIADDALLRMGQGQCQALSNIINTSEHARESLKKFRET